MRRTSAIIGAICILVFSAHATAHQRNVPAEYPTIQAAIDAAVDGDEIIVADGTYTGEGNRDVYFAGKAVTVRSESGPEKCIIDCNATQADPHVGFYFRSDATLIGLTIINGYGFDPLVYNHTGGAIYCYGRKDVRIISCIFRDNSADQGGAIYCYPDTSLTITNCTFSNNSAEDAGGAIYCDQAALTLLSCAFDRNAAKEAGGGIYVGQASSAIIDDCVISNNAANTTVAELRGGGLYCSGAAISILNSTITGNSAASGGGIYCDHDKGPTRLYISDSRIMANVVSGVHDAKGGGIYYYGLSVSPHPESGFLIIRNSTISDNKAQRTWRSAGGAIYCWRIAPIVSNCKLNANSADFGSAMFCLESRPTISGCVIAGNACYQNGYDGSIAFVHPDSAIINNCTIVRNSPSAISGGGFDHVITNCVLYYNGYDANHPMQISSRIYDVRYSNVQGGYEGVGNIDADPCFLDAGAGYWDPNGTPEDREDDFWVWTEGDYHLSPTSPCIGAGDPNYITGFRDTDLDGNPRVVGAVVDMGAYELESLPVIEAVVKLAPNTLNLQSQGRWVSCYIVLPEDYNIADIDPNSILLEDEIAPDRVVLYGRLAVVKFSRAALQELLSDLQRPGEVELLVSGQLTDGTIFEGSDIIRIVGRGRDRILRLRVGR